MADADVPAPDNRDIGTAKAAIEADGYKRVSVIGKQGNVTWRAKAYRGQTEVLLTVDGAGAAVTVNDGGCGPGAKVDHLLINEISVTPTPEKPGGMDMAPG